MLGSNTCIIILSIIILYMIFKKKSINNFSIGGAIENSDKIIKDDPKTGIQTITHMTDAKNDGHFENINIQQKTNPLIPITTDAEEYISRIIQIHTQYNQEFPSKNNKHLVKQKLQNATSDEKREINRNINSYPHKKIDKIDQISTLYNTGTRGVNIINKINHDGELS